jgi:hypothetical protein
MRIKEWVCLDAHGPEKVLPGVVRDGDAWTRSAARR